MRRWIPRSIIAGVMLSAAVGCQSTMSVEEAKKVTASFQGGAFVPPPRTISDITAILDQQKRDDPDGVARSKALADRKPPETTNAATLAEFYYQRGLAARDVGRTKQEIADLTTAIDWSRKASGQGDAEFQDIMWERAVAEVAGGSWSNAIDDLQASSTATPRDRRGNLIRTNAMLARIYCQAGNLEAAEEAARRLAALLDDSRHWQNTRPEWRAGWSANGADVRARLAEARGRLDEAEALYRQAVDDLTADPVARKQAAIDTYRGRLALVLVRQGRMLEGEKEARAALLNSLARRGRYSLQTASNVRMLAGVILEQGRYAEAETLARAAIEIYAKVGAGDDSLPLAFSRSQLGNTLVGQSCWAEALAVYERAQAALASSKASSTYLGNNLGYGVALLRTGRPEQAITIFGAALERNRRLLGDRDRGTATARALRAVAEAARGERAVTLREFADAVPVLLARSVDADDETSSRPARDQRLGMILAAYIGLLADVRGTSLERDAGIDAAAEAFRLADVARGQSVQRALDAGAARAAAKTPALADLVRREQDARKQVGALLGVLAEAMSQPTDRQDASAIAALRTQIDTLRRARVSLLEQIDKEFPAYAQLINPPPATVEQARAALRPGESLIATFVSVDRTFVWAVPTSGSIAFAAASLGRRDLSTAVTTLRKALEPNARTAGDIPAFDLALGHRLYATLLEPVASGWQGSETLLVVGHGPLGHLPFALLPTKAVPLGRAEGLLFANYRKVPWLARTHAVAVLPSVTSLATLRALPAGDPARRPFIGFGDPWFSQEQAQRAARRESTAVALATRGVPIALRSSPRMDGADSTQLSMLPRLPETADEIKSIALAMRADLTRDVFVGPAANEKSVKTADLSGYRVLAFATHGLVPGELDGLTQPALALSAPDVASVDGDGLLTMEEILGLRLNADWVVLSACNTASGSGTGSEAISGLGRAFFYAGARALLVSNWPVETTSARALTTELFRRQMADAALSRAQALRQTITWLMDGEGYTDPHTDKLAFSYAHPIFWAPFTLVGDGGR
ncbi:MAG: hypothetical protein DMD89_17890 [Candidatus Rokuibacteriota bacterium]|nr:MAG: hypothetical protein DMD89_17890 [Candidatus Rokubacteria bacterium]